MIKADYILCSSAVFTGCGTKAMPGAVAVGDGRIVFLGNLQECEGLIGGSTEIVDCGDGLIMPGFHDAHLHGYFAALYMSELVAHCGDCTSEQECVERLLPLAADVPADSWLIGTMWYHPLWENPEPPTKHSLDRLFPERPVCMINGELHNVWLNSAGLRLLGIKNESRPVEGGVYYRFPDGELTGMIGEAAATDIMRRVLKFSEDEEDKLYKNFLNYLNSKGITAFCDMALTATPGGDFVRDDIYERLLERGEMSIRVSLYPTLTRELDRPKDLRKKFKGQILRFGGVKQFFDGVSSCHTAYLKEPYTNARFEGDRGRTTIPPEEMQKLVMCASAEGFAVRVHTIGDEAIHLMLDYFAQAREICADTCGKQILEHLENFQTEDIPRLREIGVIASVQPQHIMYDIEACQRDLGAERVKLMWPFRSLLDAGAQLSFGTDCPVVECEPLWGLYEAVTRRSALSGKPEEGWNKKECITLAEAIRAYTHGSAVAAGLEDDLGTLEMGKLADICVLDRNIFEGQPENILKACVRLTMVNGKVVYRA